MINDTEASKGAVFAYVWIIKIFNDQSIDAFDYFTLFVVDFGFQKKEKKTCPSVSMLCQQHS